jgi:(2Fe-2S) ferredoxin
MLFASLLNTEVPSPPPPVSVYRVTGVVVSSVDETPVPHVHLNATLVTQGRPGGAFSMGAGPSGISADADERGRFTVTLPSAGAWHLMASATGFVTQAYEEHNNYSSAIVLTTAEPTIDLHFRLSPEAEIAGTVLDEAGECVRGARVTLQDRGRGSPSEEGQAFRNHMVTQTDDRGVYEFDGLPDGDYRIEVDAKPWYSTSNQPTFVSNTLILNPTLDVTYQATWYPGVDDSSQAEILSLHLAENRRADFHLVPIPSVHLQVPVAGQQRPIDGRPPVPFYPVLERIDNSTGPGIAQATSRNGPGGQLDIGGLAPGLYRMRIPGQDQQGQTTVIEIAPGSSGVVDLATATAEIADIAVEADPEEEGHSLWVELTNTENGQRFTSLNRNMFMAVNSSRNEQSRMPRSMSLQVPPGRYEVSLMGREGYLVGTAAKGAEISGRFLTVRAGKVTLLLHTAKGRATVDGVASVNGKPVPAAMVLLIPAGLGDPRSFTHIVQDQTNTDGSFGLNDIIPGQYILIAVDQGWKIDWKNTANLQKYLSQGIPLDLHAETKLQQNLPVQAP